jgi:uncharacterized damage-inducible protein DinB
MISKEDLLKIATKEFATTLRVLRAVPSDQKEFKPHERSSDVTRLISTFVFEMYLLESHVFGDEIDPSKFKTYKPETIQTVIDDFEQLSAKFLSRLQKLNQEDLGKTVTFAGRSFVADEFAIMMIHDQIHHRGQLTVYVRMAGGKVPSVYGPSADDTSTNL